MLPQKILRNPDCKSRSKSGKDKGWSNTEVKIGKQRTTISLRAKLLRWQKVILVLSSYSHLSQTQDWQTSEKREVECLKGFSKKWAQHCGLQEDQELFWNSDTVLKLKIWNLSSRHISSSCFLGTVSTHFIEGNLWSGTVSYPCLEKNCSISMAQVFLGGSISTCQVIGELTSWWKISIRFCLPNQLLK